MDEKENPRADASPHRGAITKQINGFDHSDDRAANQFRDDIERARSALWAIPSDIPRDDWVRVGMAANAAGLSFHDFDEWSAKADSYDRRAARDTWRSFKPDKGIGPGTLFERARANGWRPDRPEPINALQAPETASERSTRPTPAEVWARLDPAASNHPYVKAKGATGADMSGLRIVPDGDPLRICGESMAGALAVPVIRPDGTISSIQFITPPDTAARLKALGKPSKLNLPGASVDGWFTVGERATGGQVFVCEGIGQAWGCWRATERPAVVAFGWGRVRAVAQALAKQDPTARLVLVPDAGKESDAEAIAADLGAEFVTMPEGWPQNSDVADLAERDGIEALENMLAGAKQPPLPLGIVFAAELPGFYNPPDELIQGILTAGAGSILYGDSNSGKTFLAIDMACAVARGVPWMGCKTEQGLVIYIAAESPASARSRIQAYQMHNRCKVQNLAIVQSPINLHQGNDDTDTLIAAIKAVERQTGRQAALVIGDTLARMSAGANENSGEDMGLVVRRFDRVRAETGAHFMLIHHTGKDATKGARGHSSLRAAVDTEIEVTETPQGRCAELTKQRDLATKGSRIGFTLEPVTLGFTKWGEPATSCIVLPVDAPAKETKGRRLGEVEGAVMEFVVAQKDGVKKADAVRHFEGRYVKQSVYRAIKALVEAGAITDAFGTIRAA